MGELTLIEYEGFRPSGAHIRVPFGHLPPDCVAAIVGDNGAGKSTLLRLLGWAEHGRALMGASWHKQMIAPGHREAQFIVWRRMDDGRLLKVHRRVSDSRHDVYISCHPAGEFFVDGGGWMTVPGEAETLNSGLVDPGEEVLRSLGVVPTHLYQAAGAADQSGEGGFFSLAKLDDRRAVLGTAADLVWCQPLSDRAKGHRKTLNSIVDKLAAKVADMEKKATQLQEVECLIIDQQQALALASEDVDGWAAEVSRLRAAADKASGEAAAATALRAAEDRAVAECAEAKAGVARRLLEAEEGAQRPPIQPLRDRLAKALDLQAQRARLRDMYVEARHAADSAAADLSRAEATLAKLGRPGDLELLRRDEAGAEAQAKGLQAATDAEGKTRGALAEAQASLAALDSTAPQEAARLRSEVSALEARIAQMERTGAFVEEVPCKGQTIGGVDCSACPVLGEAIEARDGVAATRRELTEVRQRLNVAEEGARVYRAALVEVESKREAAAAAERALRDAQRAARTLESVRAEIQRCTDIAEARAIVEEAREAAGKKAEARDALTAEGTRLRDALASVLQASPTSPVTGAITALEEEIRRLELAEASGAEADLTMLRSAARDAGAALAKARDRQATAVEREARTEASRRQAGSALNAATEAHAEASRGRDEARWALERVRGQADPLRQEVAGLARLREALAAASQEMGDYRLMEEGFGPRGVPGLVIDAEGARLVEDMQEILDKLYSQREWEIKFSTFDPGAPKTRQELADLLVRGPGDTEWRNATQVSGGEGKMLDQAFRGALRRMIWRRKGLAFSEVLHDERDTGLSLHYQRGYVPMLRATGPGRHLLVSHNEQVNAAADYRLRLTADGGAEWVS